MSNWKKELENLIVRVDGDLEAADGSIGITATQIRIKMVQDFIENLRLSDRDELIKMLEKKLNNYNLTEEECPSYQVDYFKVKQLINEYYNK